MASESHTTTDHDESALAFLCQSQKGHCSASTFFTLVRR